MELTKCNKKSKIFFFFLVLALFSIPYVSAVTDSNPSNNALNKTITVVATRGLSIYYLGLDNPTDIDNTIAISNNFINKTYPISDDGIKFKKSDKELTSNLILFPPSYEGMLMKVYWSGLLSGYFPTHSVAVTPTNWFETHFQQKTWAGTAPLDTVFRSAIIEEDGGRHIAAHELAHPYGLCDEYDTTVWEEQNNETMCPNANLSATEPDTTCFDGETGCDTETIGKLVPWNGSSETIQMFNIMGNAGAQDSRWISNETYLELLDALTTAQANVTEALSSRLVIGAAWDNGTAEIKNLYPLGKSNLTIQSDLVAGDYFFQIFDSGNNAIVNLSFKPSFVLGIQGENTSASNFSFFAFVVNDTPEINTLRLKLNDTTLEEKTKSANTPTLNFTTNLTGILVNNNFSFAYNSTDADGDAVEYAILVSSDNGSSYSTLEIDHSSATFDVNTSGFTESQQYKVKVLATDGINTNTTVSEGVFEVDNDLRITDLSVADESGNKQIFYYRANNTLDSTLNDIQETFNTGDEEIVLSTNHSLESHEDIMVFIEYEYSQDGSKTLTAEAQSGSLVETESSSTTATTPLFVQSLSVLNASSSERIFEISVINNLASTMTAVNWSLDTKDANVINATSNVQLANSEDLFVYLHYNFSGSGTYNVNATARNGTLTDSLNLTITV